MPKQLIVIAAAGGFFITLGVGLLVGYSFRSGSSDFSRASGDLINDSDLFRYALKRSNFVRIPTGEYFLTEPIVIPNGKTLFFENATLDTWGGPAIVADGSRGWTIAGDVTIQAQGDAENAVVITDPIDARIDNMTISGAVGSAVVVSGISQSLPRSNTLSIGRLDVANNGVGLDINAGAGAEFVTIQTFEARSNGTAAIVAAGSTKILGGNVVDNKNGVLFTEGPNNGHGTLSGLTVAHNSGFNLRFDGVTNGFVVAGNSIYGDSADAGLIEIDRSQGIVISGGILSAHLVVTNPAGPSIICGNFMPTGTSSITGELSSCL